MRYVPQLKRNLISVGALEALGLVISIRDGVLKMIKVQIRLQRSEEESVSLVQETRALES